MKTNFELLTETVNYLANSQGFYSRLKRNLKDLTENELDELKTKINNLPKFKNSIDVIHYLEA